MRRNVYLAETLSNTRLISLYILLYQLVKKHTVAVWMWKKEEACNSLWWRLQLVSLMTLFVAITNSDAITKRVHQRVSKSNDDLFSHSPCEQRRVLMLLHKEHELGITAIQGSYPKTVSRCCRYSNLQDIRKSDWLDIQQHQHPGKNVWTNCTTEKSYMLQQYLISDFWALAIRPVKTYSFLLPLNMPAYTSMFFSTFFLDYYYAIGIILQT